MFSCFLIGWETGVINHGKCRDTPSLHRVTGRGNHWTVPLSGTQDIPHKTGAPPAGRHWKYAPHHRSGHHPAPSVNGQIEAGARTKFHGAMANARTLALRMNGDNITNKRYCSTVGMNF